MALSEAESAAGSSSEQRETILGLLMAKGKRWSGDLGGVWGKANLSEKVKQDKVNSYEVIEAGNYCLKKIKY